MTLSSEGHHDHFAINESKTRIVVLITAVTMIVEVLFGYLTNSMALLADGYHMASHVLALGLSLVAYVYARKYSQSAHLSFKKEKLLALSGFTSALILQIVAVAMAFKSFTRFLHPQVIRFNEAIFVAAIGLIVNIASALILYKKDEYRDHNIRSAYLHVLADGLTSVTAIIALTIGSFTNSFFLDALSGIISSVVITKWAIELMMSSGRELIDFEKRF